MGGAVSNALAVAILYPAILLKTHIQHERRPVSILEALETVLKGRGIKGLYDGLQPQLVKGFLKEGLTMMTKQRIEAFVIALYLMSRRKSIV